MKEPQVGEVFFAHTFFTPTKAYTVGDVPFVGRKEIPTEIRKHYPEGINGTLGYCYALPDGREVFGFEVYLTPKAEQAAAVKGREVVTMDIDTYRRLDFDMAALVRQDKNPL